jgi:hypothetical protein
MTEQDKKIKTLEKKQKWHEILLFLVIVTNVLSPLYLNAVLLLIQNMMKFSLMLTEVSLIIDRIALFFQYFVLIS